MCTFIYTGRRVKIKISACKYKPRERVVKIYSHAELQYIYIYNIVSTYIGAVGWKRERNIFHSPSWRAEVTAKSMNDYQRGRITARGFQGVMEIVFA